MPQTIRPWYKEFWPWMMLGILGSSVIVGTTYLVMSIVSFDGMVEDDYYKHGLAINQVLEKDHRAAALGLSAELRIDDLTGDITLELQGDTPATEAQRKELRPERLILALIFPAQDGRDQTLTLERVRDNHYIGQAPNQLKYRWYLQVAPDGADADWRLTGEARFPSQDPISLKPGNQVQG